MTQPFLCAKCELRFSEMGEAYVIPLLRQHKKFSLLDRLKLAEPLYVAQNNAAFICSSVGFDAQKIGYFGLSIRDHSEAASAGTGERSKCFWVFFD